MRSIGVAILLVATGFAGCLLVEREVVLPKTLHIVVRHQTSSDVPRASYHNVDYDFKLLDANGTVAFSANGTLRAHFPDHAHLELFHLASYAVQGEARFDGSDEPIPIHGAVHPEWCPSAPEAHLVVEFQGFAFSDDGGSVSKRVAQVEFRCSEHWETAA